MLKTQILLVGTLLTSVAQAQDVPGITRIRAQGPVQHARLNLDTGEVQMLADPIAAPTVVSCYTNNVDPDGLLDALLFPAGDELFDWGIKACGGSDFVESIVIGYASQAVPVPLGGPGGSLTLRLYEDGRGFGIAGTERVEIQLSGLPSEGFVPPGAALSPVMLTVELGAQSFYLPTGPIAWSYENPDGLTAPLLVDVVIENGTQNFFDVYRPGPASAGHLLGTFTLPPGGASDDPYENSFLIVINEDDTTGSTVDIPAGSNPNVFIANRPILGQLWVANVNQSSFPTSTATVMALSSQRLIGTTTRFGELIFDPATSLLPVSLETGNAHRYIIPVDASLVGRLFYAQGGVLTTAQGLLLTNARECVVGTF
jgi:hypothetical protein